MVEALTWEAWVTLGIIILMMIALIKDVARPDLVMLGCLGLLLLFGILTPEEAFAGLSNSAVLAVGALFVVAAGVQNTGALSLADRLLFPKSARTGSAILRMMFTTSTMSAFLNNTPIVAMLIPRVQEWSEKHGIPASKLMIPLSYGAILGGMTTLIGTSTNLLVSGLMQASGYEGLGMFDFTLIGGPAALAGILYFTLVGYRLLPDRGKERLTFSNELKNCLFEARVTSRSHLIGQTIEEAGLRSLAEAYLVHLRRRDQVIPSSPDVLLQAGDVLTFHGSTSVLDQLLERPGLERVVERLNAQDHVTLPLYEAVVAEGSRLVGKTLREAGFRERYQGVVLGLHRRDEQIEGALGRIPIKAGDLLLIEARNDFDKHWNERREEFYLVAPRRPQKVGPRRGKAPLALAILIGVILFAALGVASIVTTAFIGALAMIVTRCLHGREARRSVDLQVLVVIAAALGLGRAIESSGLADGVAHVIVGGGTVFGTVGVLVAVYLSTSLLTELITNNASAALMLGIGLAAARDVGAPPEAFALAVAIAASASFLTPIGYQTNLMVLAAGGYRFGDYIKSGMFVSLIVATMTITMIWLIWL